MFSENDSIETKTSKISPAGCSSEIHSFTPICSSDEIDPSTASESSAISFFRSISYPHSAQLDAILALPLDSEVGRQATHPRGPESIPLISVPPIRAPLDFEQLLKHQIQSSESIP